MRRKRRDWPKLVAQWRASGESAVEFGTRVGVSARTVCRWRREISKVAPQAPSTTLAKIVEVRPAQFSADEGFEVRLGGGRSIGMPASFDEVALARLLRVLEAAS